MGGFSVMWVTKLLISPVKKKGVLGQLWSFLGKKSFFFYWRNQKFCYPHNGKPTQAPCSHWFLVGHWTKCAKNGNIWPKMTKNADFGPNLADFGPKSLIFMGLSKSFGTNITENHIHNLSALFFGQALDQVGQKCRYLAQFGHFWAQNPIFWGQGVKILVPSYRDSNKTPFSC